MDHLTQTIITALAAIGINAGPDEPVVQMFLDEAARGDNVTQYTVWQYFMDTNQAAHDLIMGPIVAAQSAGYAAAKAGAPPAVQTIAADNAAATVQHQVDTAIAKASNAPPPPPPVIQPLPAFTPTPQDLSTYDLNTVLPSGGTAAKFLSNLTPMQLALGALAAVLILRR